MDLTYCLTVLGKWRNFLLVFPAMLGTCSTRWKRGKENWWPTTIPNICGMLATSGCHCKFLTSWLLYCSPRHRATTIPISYQLKGRSSLGVNLALQPRQSELELEIVNILPFGNHILCPGLPTSCSPWAGGLPLGLLLAKTGQLLRQALPFLPGVWYHIYKCHLLCFNKNTVKRSARENSKCICFSQVKNKNHDLFCLSKDWFDMYWTL